MVTSWGRRRVSQPLLGNRLGGLNVNAERLRL